MKKSFLSFLSIVLLAVVASSCLSKQSRKPLSSGKTNEILVITNTKAIWEGNSGEAIRQFFGQEMIGLPQSEPMFDFYNIADAHFTKIHRKFHNIFIVDIDPKRKKTLVETKKDHWAFPQRIIKITASSEENFIQKFNEQKESYLQLYEQTEKERTIRNFDMATDISIANKLIKHFNLYMAVPGSFHIAKRDSSFIWLRHTVDKVQQDVELGIMIYFDQYTDTAAFNPEYIIAQRNAVTLQYIPGPSRGSYMVVAENHVPPNFSLAHDFVVEYAVETRGLWELVNDFMGGPFISYTFVDETHNRVITLDGYVYNPNQPKRTYIRHLESIFHTLELQ